MSKINDLAGKYAGQVGYIVGKGPSLQWLTAGCFSHPAAPVVVLNDAILKVQELNISNPIYSLQKDGCGARHENDRCRPDCGSRGHMVYPKDESIVLIQQAIYSPYCLPRHKNKIWIDIKELRINEPSEMAVIMAIEIMRIFGCRSITMVSCGSLVNPGELRTFDPRSGRSCLTGAGQFYKHARGRVLEKLQQFHHTFVIPEAKNGN